MKKIDFRNIFLAIGLVAVIIMLFTFDMSYAEVWSNVKRAGYWFPACVVLWLFIYMMNALGWRAIINDGTVKPLSYLRVLRYTISGFALNNVTPVGLLGGEPYRIMELTPLVGAAKATSSVILNAMMHILSHFCFWSLSLLLYLFLYGRTMSVQTGCLMAFFALFCASGIYFFFKGYRQGLAMKALRLVRHIPGLRRRTEGFIQRKAPAIQKIDEQIAALHATRPTSFCISLLLELGVRIAGCLEIQFILYILTDHVSFSHCVLLQAFTSLFSILLFFVPMSMGAREGGFALGMNGLSLAGSYGVYTSLLVRLRELVWIAIGLLLIKLPVSLHPRRPA